MQEKVLGLPSAENGNDNVDIQLLGTHYQE